MDLLLLGYLVQETAPASLMGVHSSWPVFAQETHGTLDRCWDCGCFFLVGWRWMPVMEESISVRIPRLISMNPKQVGALRRAGIYFVVGYGGLVLVNNSGLELDNMWVAYLPMFIAVYFFSRWADAKIASRSSNQSKD